MARQRNQPPRQATEAGGKLVSKVLKDVDAFRTGKGGSSKPDLSKPLDKSKYDKRIFIDPKKYPETAAHIRKAQNDGHPRVLTKDSANKSEVRKRRRAATKVLPPKKRNTEDRDEYPFASTKEGGEGSSVQYVKWDDNQGAGNEIKNQWAGVPQGSRIWVDTYARSGGT
ncbi:NucA/NucB deoxyribonuclease domain-containing protein [Glycomyces sp. NPDC021274]|jgi:hypothetical protein|uniref:NucA/NucB deoxyribonuclease domain-containing protein n=1 Tax=Glycomyces sp. NPDC021274 TaxID=3155120 RepID=UPI0033C6EAA8